MNQLAVLPVGGSLSLGWTKCTIFYAGMPSEKVFSIVQKKIEFVYRGYAWNLFFPKQQGNITIDGVSILVENVTPDEIRLRISR